MSRRTVSVTDMDPGEFGRALAGVLLEILKPECFAQTPSKRAKSAGGKSASTDVMDRIAAEVRKELQAWPDAPPGWHEARVLANRGGRHD